MQVFPPFLTAPPLTFFLDPTPQVHTEDLSAFAGQSVRVIVRAFIPENFTGPGFAEFDNFDLSGPIVATE